ncbi:hypothetical protein PG996_008200 [Apiospora saccharicola]|uniref:Monooxygenase n=1 Tax=Apiospora saccharicola TaxID=335842 RepID=A0ABR1UX82_9PEZI
MQFSPMLKAYAWPSRSQRSSNGPEILEHSLIRDSFTISTWLAMGAAAQCLLAACLPLQYALLPAPALLLCRLVKTVLMTAGLVKHDFDEGVIRGKYTAQVPGPNGTLPTSPSENGVCLLMLAARTNHPMGAFSPGFKKLGTQLEKMRAALEDDKAYGDRYGFLCQTTFLVANERRTGSQLMMMCYFRSVDGIHAFAHGPLHREAWTWWYDITKKYPHLSIQHELYNVPPGHWENIYVNAHPSGLAIDAPVRCERGWTRPLFDARKLSLKTTMGRLGRSDGTDNDKYGPEPY